MVEVDNDTVPIVGNPPITASLSVCRLCLNPIAGVHGSWVGLTWNGAPRPGGVACATTTGEVTGHIPEEVGQG